MTTATLDDEIVALVNRSPKGLNKSQVRAQFRTLSGGEVRKVLTRLVREKKITSEYKQSKPGVGRATDYYFSLPKHTNRIGAAMNGTAAHTNGHTNGTTAPTAPLAEAAEKSAEKSGATPPDEAPKPQYELRVLFPVGVGPAQAALMLSEAFKAAEGKGLVIERATVESV